MKEETGVDTQFRSIVAFRHGHEFNFGCSDLYIIVALRPLSTEITPDSKEISAAQWMPIQVNKSQQRVRRQLIMLSHNP